jgi:hypothetical protein
MKRLRLIADWDMVLQELDSDGCPGQAIDPRDLSLSTETCDALSEWYSAYAEMNSEGKDSSDTKDVDIFDQRGRELWRTVQSELSSDYQVSYYSELLGRVIFGEG